MLEMKISPKAIILCDDVRVEASGKQILIGVYTSSIIFQTFPATMAINIWIAAEVSDPGSVELNFRGDFRQDSASITLFEVKGSFDIEAADDYSIVHIGALPLTFPGPGKLLIEMQVGRGRWHLLRSVPVDLKAAAVTASPPPA